MKSAALVILALVFAGCQSEPLSSLPGIPFDPTTLVPGDRVGDLVADSLSIHQGSDSSWTGMARFRGELVVGGHTIRPPDASGPAICFEADSSSAARMPRWAGDERKPWFCFSNPAEAARELGPAEAPRPATIVVDWLSIRHGRSDQVNSAHFVRLLARG